MYVQAWLMGRGVKKKPGGNQVVLWRRVWACVHSHVSSRDGKMILGIAYLIAHSKLVRKMRGEKHEN